MYKIFGNIKKAKRERQMQYWVLFQRPSSACLITSACGSNNGVLEVKNRRQRQRSRMRVNYCICCPSGDMLAGIVSMLPKDTRLCMSKSSTLSSRGDR